MKTTKILVSGKYGVKGEANFNYQRVNVNLSAYFNQIWVINYDGTPEGFHLAWMNAFEKGGPRLFEALKQIALEEGVAASQISEENGTIFGIGAGILWMTVVKEWDQYIRHHSPIPLP